MLLAGAVNAQDLGRPISTNLLLSAGEWSKLCRNNGLEAGACLIKLTRPATNKAGRGGDEFIVPMPPAKTLLTRSGALLAPSINKRISVVLTDNGNITNVVLRSGEECKIFAAHGDLLRDHADPQAYSSLMRFITDDPAASIDALEPTRISSKPAYRFTQSETRLLGAYVLDAKHNAGVWAVCQSAAASLPGPGAQELLAAIIGSARRY
jgi:hypothetical protein